jgi:hypothetical protein
MAWGCHSDHKRKETAMAEAGLSLLTKLTEFFSTAHSEASARRTGFVQRAAKITGKVFLALVTVGQWSAAKTSLAQLAATAAQVADPIDVSPAALPQRMNSRALAFLRELLQAAVATLHTADTVCAEALFTPFPQVYLADSPGLGLPASLRAAFPGTGGSASPAGAKIQLVWDYKSRTFAHFALGPGNLPDNKYVDTVVSLLGKGALVLFDLGYCKLTAFADSVAAGTYFLSRLQPQATLWEAVAGHLRPGDLGQELRTESRLLLEKAVFLGAQERVATRLLAVRMPEAVVNERRRQARRHAKKRGHTPSQAHLTLWAWNLFITHVPDPVWTPQTIGKAYSLRWQVALVCKAWKSPLHLATLPTKTVNRTLGYRSGRLLLMLLPCALYPTLRATMWITKRRELSLLKLICHLPALADRWLHLLFAPSAALCSFLRRAYTTAERLVLKAVRKRRTTAQLLRDSLASQYDFFKPARALAA